MSEKGDNPQEESGEGKMEGEKLQQKASGGVL